MSRLRSIIALTLLVLLAFGGQAQAQRTAKELFEGETRAPEFPPDLDWINSESPLTMSGLLGKIVVFDFWTYGCINCLHVIPVLEQVEQKFADEVVVVGVHSAKFENEGQTENLQQIVQRYGIHHPVINDNQFEVVGQLWRPRLAHDRHCGSARILGDTAIGRDPFRNIRQLSLRHDRILRRAIPGHHRPDAA